MEQILEEPGLFQCSTCCVVFNQREELELHIASYRNLTHRLINRLHRAAAHLIPVETEDYDVSQVDLNVQCPYPRCSATIGSPSLVERHFVRHIRSIEICPGCKRMFMSANKFLNHTNRCRRVGRNASNTQLCQQRRRALYRRARVQFKRRRDLLRASIPSEDQDEGSRDSLSQGHQPGHGDANLTLMSTTQIQAHDARGEPSWYTLATLPAVIATPSMMSARAIVPTRFMHVLERSIYTANGHAPMPTMPPLRPPRPMPGFVFLNGIDGAQTSIVEQPQHMGSLDAVLVNAMNASNDRQSMPEPEESD